MDQEHRPGWSPRCASTTGGSALVGITFLVAILSMLALSSLTTTRTSLVEQAHAQGLESARQIAEAGLSDGVNALRGGRDANLGRADEPVPFGGGGYHVIATGLSGDLVQLVSEGRRDAYASRLELTVRVIPGESIEYAAFGGQSLRLDVDALIDSYDSALGNYDSQLVGRIGDRPHARDGALVGSNGQISLAAGVELHGDLHAGPLGILLLLQGLITGSLQLTSDTLALGPVEIPALELEGALILAAGEHRRLAPGDHRYHRIFLGAGATLEVPGPGILVAGSLELGIGASLLADTVRCPVQLYVERDCILNPRALLASLRRIPGELEVHLAGRTRLFGLLGPNDRAHFGVDSEVYATVNAPGLRVELENDVDVFGSLKSRQLDLSTRVAIHFDERLARGRCDTPAEVEIVAWRVLPQRAGGGGD